MRTLKVLSVASGFGANHDGCQNGPFVLEHSLYFRHLLAKSKVQLQWSKQISPDKYFPDAVAVADLCQRVFLTVQSLQEQDSPLLLIGGDHSCAMGLWPGLVTSLEPDRTMGLIWIDAHMDLHNFATSPSGNIHGMPLAALLGQGDPLLSAIYGFGPTIEPENLALVGTRSFEPEEVSLQKQLNINCYDMQQITGAGSSKTVLEEAVTHVTRHTDRFGISIDLDALDPTDSPGVGTPEPNGIRTNDLCEALAIVNGDERLAGIEIAEFNPEFDRDQRTQRTIAGLITALFGDSSKAKRSFGLVRDGIKSTDLPMSNSSANR